VTYKVLDAFEGLFQNTTYRHRDSSRGDHVASFLVDDLYSLARSPKLVKAVDTPTSVLNRRNTPVGRRQRRGDGTFGKLIPGDTPFAVSTHIVKFGEVADVEVGAETKILAKAMIKQIDRVCTDLINQATQFKVHGGSPITVALVGVNFAPVYQSFEGERVFVTNGRNYPHPIAEAQAAIEHIMNRVVPVYDEVVVLRFIATNMPPFSFSWVDAARTNAEYGAALVRISSRYEARF